jgi:AraC-like DNA-binding protein
MEDARTSWLTAADSYISECEATRSSLRASEFAVRMRRTPAQLAREFHACVGFRVKDYFRKRQVEHAKELLRETGRTTGQIAIDAGFGTPRTFYRVFRRSTGVSPTAFRKETSLAIPEFRP